MDADARTRALVVDDHETNRLVLRLFLEEMMGIHVEEAADGASALELFRQGCFDLVFMDIEMPVMNGLAATASIRSLEEASGLPAVPIIVVSAFCDPEHQARSRQAGATAHVAKPVAFDPLRQIVRDLCARARFGSSVALAGGYGATGIGRQP